MSRLSPLFIAQQLQTQRQNLTSACRLAVKTLIDKSCFGIIDDGCKELENFINILEHIFSHRLKPYNTWYGGQEARCFWDYIRIACQRVPHNCLASIDALEMPQTAHGKGRAWIRMCLMEKRLADYVSVAMQHTKLTENFYDEGSLMLSDDINMLSDLLISINCIDFSFDIKGIYLDHAALPAIDFTPYLRYSQSVDTSYPAIAAAGVDESITGDQLGVEFWKTRCSKLEEQYKIANEQKNYVEEMLRLREMQLFEVSAHRQRLTETIQLIETERKRDQVQLESVIMELQSQLLHMKDENRTLLQKMRSVSHGWESPVISMSQLLRTEARSSNDNEYAVVQIHSTDEVSNSSTGQSESLIPQTKLSEFESSADQQSIMSTGDGKEDVASTVALAGSFSLSTGGPGLSTSISVEENQ